jgi:hypothetical protein
VHIDFDNFPTTTRRSAALIMVGNLPKWRGEDAQVGYGSVGYGTVT